MPYSEQDFKDLAFAVAIAEDDGDIELARRLDVLARKANADCTRQSTKGRRGLAGGSKPIRWQDMPYTSSLIGRYDDHEKP